MDSIKAERELSLKETRKRIERMSTQDIRDMPVHYLLRLTHDFSDEGILRLIVSRGENKEEKDYILTSLNQTYEWWLRGFDGNDAEFYFGILGYPTDQMPHYDDIDFDIATNTPLLPDEEESPLPTSPEGEELGLGMGLLESRIAELEKENETLKQQIEELQSQPQTSEVQQASTNEAIVELFSYVMYGDEKNAKAFIESAKGRNDVEITDLVAQWVRENKISSTSCRRDLWRLLHAYKLYNGTESNYNTAMRNKQ